MGEEGDELDEEEDGGSRVASCPRYRGKRESEMGGRRLRLQFTELAFLGEEGKRERGEKQKQKETGGGKEEAV